MSQKLSFYTLAAISKPDFFNRIYHLKFISSKINDDPVTIASQMNNSNVFIITVDYHDNSGVATDLLNQISTPYMNFSSDANDAVAEISQGLCYGKQRVGTQLQLYGK